MQKSEFHQPSSRFAHWTFWVLALLLSFGAPSPKSNSTGQPEPERKLSTVEMPFAGRVLKTKAQLWREVKKGEVGFALFLCDS